VKKTTGIIVSLLLCAAANATAQDQSTLDLFRYDPVRYFTGASNRQWTGNVQFMLTDYSDTLTLAADPAKGSLLIYRRLFRLEDSALVSLGSGTVVPDPGDTTYSVRWNEKGYAEASGQMHWRDGQWEIAFDGEWNQWSLIIRRESDFSFSASLARAVGQFPPVELAKMTYNAIPGEK